MSGKSLLRGRLDHKRRCRLARLLDMMVTPHELADEIGFNPRQVYRVFLPSGCPHQRDEKNRIWINPKPFAAWARDPYAKRKLAAGEAFCITCKKPVEMVDPAPHRKGTLRYVTCDCPECGRKLSRITAEERGKT